ncbi:hypothetical protein LZ198_30025 [Myxococcus sp. K15C18031901]|uniref:heavy metal-binding domain-containing protein n=1 Tax=Myxococcus dinghuensis TaxID=2906761 RepID=UPI0020A7FB07|nr:heavy metal-binding domain-containing protein [Myxococcus dinghuensis]MCP3103125.1 hypothetical protein [Myxococcus dinghuensis]
MRSLPCVLASLFTLAACASEPKRLPPALDPSSPEAPEAPEAPLAALPSTLASADSHAHHDAASEPSTQKGDDAGTTVYTCPMDPEVRSSTEGRCPKCGMKLVPEKKPQTPPTGHEQHGGHGAHP